MLFQDLPSELIVLIVIQCAYQHAARLSCTNSNIHRIVWPEAEKMRIDHCVRFEQAAASIRRISPRHAASINGVRTTLKLDNTDRIGPTGATAIAKALRGNKVLTALNLRSNDIGCEGAVAIGKALEANEVLTTLVLSHNKIRDEGAMAIGEALRVNELLKNIDLRHIHLGDEGKGVIRDAVGGRDGFKLEM